MVYLEFDAGGKNNYCRLTFSDPYFDIDGSPFFSAWGYVLFIIMFSSPSSYEKGVNVY
jgi:hypothetical protein